jgi:hypothetical protein
VTGWDALRAVIMLAATAAVGLWIWAGAKTRRWGLTATALSFLVPVLMFLALRLVYHNVTVLNYISLGLYLEVICLLAAMAVAVARVRR